MFYTLSSRLLLPPNTILVTGPRLLCQRASRLTDCNFYRAMHFSAKRGIAIACRLSVRLSVCMSVCLSVCNVGEL